MKSVIPFSIGLDSTYVLWKTLTSTDDDVTAFFLTLGPLAEVRRRKYDLRSFGDFFRKGDFTERAEEIVAWLKANVRDFTFELQEVNTNFLSTEFGNPNNPQTYSTRYAVSEINAGNFDRLILCAEKENDGHANGGTIQKRRPGSMASLDLFKATATRGQISFPLIDSSYTQAVALSEMPQELIDLTHSCQNDLPSPCQQCFKCKKRAFFCEELGKGKSAELVGQETFDRCLTEDGKWYSMKFWMSGIEEGELTKWEIPEWPSSYEVPSSG